MEHLERLTDRELVLYYWLVGEQTSESGYDAHWDKLWDLVDNSGIRISMKPLLKNFLKS